MPAAAGSVIGGVASIVSGNQAAGAAEAAARQANRVQLQMYNGARAAQAPYSGAGTNALNTLTGLYGLSQNGNAAQAAFDQFRNSTGYQFRLGQGQEQMDRLAARGGNFFSGRALQAGQEFGQNFASNEFANYSNQLNALAGMGQNAANAISGAGQNYANAYGNNVNGAAATAGSAYLNSGNALNSLIGNYYYGRGGASGSVPYGPGAYGSGWGG